MAEEFPGQFHVMVVDWPVSSDVGLTLMLGGCWEGGQLEFGGAGAEQEPLH